MEPLEPLAPDARELLAAYRRERPGPHGRARNWPAVRERVDARPRARHPLSFAWWFGGLALALAAAVLFLVHALFVAWQATHVARTTPPSASDELVDAAPIEAAPASPAVAPAVAPRIPPAIPVAPPVVAPTPVQRPRVAAPATTAVARTDTTSEELVLVAAARTALADGDWAGALEQLDEHARRFPDGVLTEERAALRAIGLCRSRAADARTAVLAFGSRYPGSHHHRSIKAACAERTDAPTP